MYGLAVRLLPYVLSFFSSLCIMILELVASRLVAQHVGGSLIVWTSVIGIILGGICLGNVLGGRLADRVEPSRAIGPLYALGSFLTLFCLWTNAVVGLAPGLNYLPWDARTVIIVTLDFLIPATVLGMISPVVAKMAVEQARKSGSALGDVYFLGAVGSIVGTFIAGFWLIYLAPTSTIIAVIGAAYALLAAALLGDQRVAATGLGAALGVGVIAAALGALGVIASVLVGNQRTADSLLNGAQYVGVIAGIVAALGLSAAALKGRIVPALLGVGAVAFLILGAIEPTTGRLAVPGLVLGSIKINALACVGHTLALALAVLAGRRLLAERWSAEIAPETEVEKPAESTGVKLGDLAVLAFVASLTFMALEMVAGRLVSRHLGSSVYGWTSVIGVLLGGLSLGNYLGGKIADRIKSESQASWLFLAASVLSAAVLLTESPTRWMIRNPIGHWVRGEPGVPLAGDDGPWLSQAISMTGYPWWFRVLFWTTLVFLLPSMAMGTVSPVVAKLAVDRVRRLKRTGAAIGQVYAWGMVGSILGTFLTGFLLIDMLGTKGVLLVIATGLALAATALGSVWHAAWAGIPLGLCVIAFTPGTWFYKQGLAWGIREERGDPNTTQDAIAYIDESNYYYIKVTNEPDAEGQKRTLVLDNLIHGYFILDHPERLDYDYEHIYALVTRRVMEAKAKAAQLSAPEQAPLRTLFLGGGSYTFPRYLQHVYPKTIADVAEIDPAVTRANHIALGLPKDTTIRTTWGDARQFVVNHPQNQYDIVFGDAFNDFSVPWHLTTKEFNGKIAQMLTPNGVYMINIIDVYKSDEKARTDAKKGKADTPSDPEQAVAEARRLGGFLSSWVNTAKLTFPYIYVFGTDEVPGGGLRETFVVVASKGKLDLDDLGSRLDDPQFFEDGRLFEPRPFPESDMEQLAIRSRGIVLTDDYAPVENLLAPVAATRGED
ncbi:MAG: fused MFS/spermidine synthase [Isosphaeraceae bacterium]|nr:fused MFS/spermidine synthase [Isosphaeraceae bacterium]